MANKLTAIPALCGIQIRQNMLTKRALMIALLIAVYIYSMLEPIKEFSLSVGYPVTPFAYPFLVGDSLCTMIIAAGIIGILSNAPFYHGMADYVAVRSGRGSMIAANACFICLLCLVYTLYVAVISIVALIPALVLDDAWGKVWGTLTRTTAQYEIRLQFEMNDNIRALYKPIEAMLKTFLLQWGFASFLGGVIYVGNIRSKRPIGTWIACGFVPLDIVIYNCLPVRYAMYSPISFSTLSGVTRSIAGTGFEYALLFYIGGFTLCMTASYCIDKSGVWRSRWNKRTRS